MEGRVTPVLAGQRGRVVCSRPVVRVGSLTLSLGTAGPPANVSITLSSLATKRLRIRSADYDE